MQMKCYNLVLNCNSEPSPLQVMFSFEAGRRCDSGPGNFTFETKQGNEIFVLVDQAIQSQKALAEDRHLSGPSSYDPDCPTSLLLSGDGSCSSREADGDSGGSKPGSGDGVLGKREGGDGGMGRGQVVGVKGRCLPELPAMLGAGSWGQAPAKAPPAADGPAGVYSEPADSVRLPTYDSLYSDPADSIVAQSQTAKATTPPTPTPRLRPAGDETLGDHHHVSGGRKPPDLFSHAYAHISMELKQKTAALSLNGGGKRGGMGGNRKARPSGGQAEGTPSSSSSEHIYDEPEGCAQAGVGASTPLEMSIYDEAWVEPKRQGEAVTPSGLDENYSTLSLGNMSESNRQSTPQLGPIRPLRWTKPAPAPKPAKGGFARKEPIPLPFGKHGGPGSNVNNNNNIMWGGGGRKEIYSQVSKQKASSPPWLEQQKKTPIRPPDIIYDNLGNI